MSQSSEDVPLASRMAAAKASQDDVPLASRKKPAAGALQEDSDSDDEVDIPLSQRSAGRKKPAAPKSAAKRPRESGGANKPAKRSKAAASESRRPARDAAPRKRKAPGGGGGGGGNGGSEKKWETLVHGGVLFPPEYEPHGIKMKYDNVPVDLTPEQEEVATMYAVMLETDYLNKQTFVKNFWEEFKKVLGPGHVIKDLAKCDFRDIYNHLQADREAKKALSKEEKTALKEQREALEMPYKFALVDGEKEPVGNFRVEPPGLFRGRGEHPKMGKLKSRIYPRDITINIGKDVPIPTHPYEGQNWKEVRHDQTVTWLAFWKDPIDSKGYKYVWLGANARFKTEADLAKYEKARKLKDHIERIRADYQLLWDHADLQQRQMSTALYFIDELALRAGHEKDEDEADTVGCCTLKVENVEMLPNHQMKLDFLGKDSIRYENTVTVHAKVWANMQQFVERDGQKRPKVGSDQVFDTMEANHLNNMMKEYMDGLSVKVFRTYNASVTLDRLLWQKSDLTDPVEIKAAYDRANKEVAILCNHQKAVAKTHETSMQKMTDNIDKAKATYKQLELDLAAAKGKNKPTEVDGLKRKMDAAKARLDKLVVMMDSREELKTVALGTSKINYLDPRITVAWCKRVDLPIERVFNKSLHGKFSWAMEVEPEFKF